MTTETAIQNLLQRRSIDLAADTCTEAAEALIKAPNAKLTVNFSFVLVNFADRIVCTPTASFSTRTTIDGQEDSETTENPNQPTLAIE